MAECSTTRDWCCNAAGLAFTASATTGGIYIIYPHIYCYIHKSQAPVSVTLTLIHIEINHEQFDGESWDDLQTRDADRLLQTDLRSCLSRYTAGVSRFRRTTTGVSSFRNAAVSPHDVNLICDDYYVIPPPPPPRAIDFKGASCGCCGVM